MQIELDSPVIPQEADTYEECTNENASTHYFQRRAIVPK